MPSHVFFLLTQAVGATKMCFLRLPYLPWNLWICLLGPSPLLAWVTEDS